MPDYLDDLRLAHVLADAADAATMDRFKALDLKVETKPDMTPVSEADKAAEELIRGHLSRARPRDSVHGEEFGVAGTGPRRWVIDPIDGTKNYVRGGPGEKPEGRYGLGADQRHGQGGRDRTGCQAVGSQDGGHRVERSGLAERHRREEQAQDETKDHRITPLRSFSSAPMGPLPRARRA